MRRADCDVIAGTNARLPRRQSAATRYVSAAVASSDQSVQLSGSGSTHGEIEALAAAA